MARKPAKAAKRKAPAPAPAQAPVDYDDDNGDVLFEARSIVAIRSDDDDRFFVAELLDDTTEGMLADASAEVNVLYFDKTDKGTYVVGNYDMAPVRAIMCEIVLEAAGLEAYRLPTSHLHRITRVLSAIDAGEAVPEADAQPLKKRKTAPDSPDAGVPSRASAKQARGSSKPKIDKKSGLPYLTVHVAEDVTDDEVSGEHAFGTLCHDVLATSREVIRAVRTQNYALLEELLTPAATARMYTLYTGHSVALPKSGLEYAIEANDLKALAIFMASKDKKLPFAKKT
ncbi:hypothetical protein ACHHYP_15688, partial [Achlya hypogyna]